MAQTKVILRTKIDGLGAEADVVKVKAGFARNFLIPTGRAYEASKGNLRHLDTLQKERAERETADLATAEKLAAKIKKLKPEFILETGAGGKAFGSVTNMDIHKKLEELGIEINRTAIKLDQPIKQLCTKDIAIKVHADITTILKVKVVSDKKEEAAAGA